MSGLPKKTRFGAMLEGIIDQRGISQNKIADLLGVSGSFINQIIKGRSTAPFDAVREWPKKLGLDQDEAKFFIAYAYLTHLPAGGEECVLSLIDSDHMQASAIAMHVEYMGKSHRRIVEISQYESKLKKIKDILSDA